MSNDLPIVIVGVAHLPVADRDVVGDRVAGDHLVRAVGGHVAAARADHDRELALVVEQVRDLGHVHVVVRADHAGDLLVEEHRELGRLHAALGDVVGVVEPDRQELARLDGRQQTHLLQWMALGRVVPVEDILVLDDPVARSGAGVEATEPHDDISGISTGACSGA